MASLSSSDSPGGEDPVSGIDSSRSEDPVSSTDSPERDDLGNNLPMPAPWAAAIAVLALLAFGVFVGSAASPAAPSGAATPTLLVLASTAKKPFAAIRTATATPPPAAAAPTPLPSGEAGNETGEPAATSTVKAAPAPTTKTSAPKTGKNTTEKPGAPRPSATAALPPIKHVFLIVLSDQGAAAAFGPSSPAPYLAKTLSGEGELLENYYAVGQGELANAIALISGQGPTPQTAGDCPQYTDIAPGAVGPEGQVLGSGCVYPSQTLTLANQLTAAGKTWKAYVEGLEAGEPGQPASCRHPALGDADPDNTASPGDPYVTWRNPFVYFHSLIDGGECATDDVGLGQLSPDLKTASSTPSLSYIVPDGCDDGSATPCAAGAPGGLPAAEGFLRKVVPEIEASAAYREGGLIAITSDQAPQTGPGADSSGCCMTSAYPNLPATSPPATPSPASATPANPIAPSTGLTPPSASGTNGAPTATPTGGGRVGLLLISKYVKPGTLNVTGEYNHFALLRSIENLFGLKPLGYAAAPGLLAFDSSVFNAYK
jgi:phosphatidylinositol-3-phosphatase